MKFIKSKKAFALLGATIVAVAAVGAYAYFTTSGSGTGTATVGHSTAFTISGTTTGFAYPGQTQDVTIDVNNNGSGNQTLSGDIYLAHVRACSAGGTWTGTYAGGSCSTSDVPTCESLDLGSTTNPVTADADWYMADIHDTTDYTPGLHAAADTGHLTMNDFGDQTAAGCENAGLTLFFSTR
jgi:hypothetical protein